MVSLGQTTGETNNTPKVITYDKQERIRALAKENGDDSEAIFNDFVKKGYTIEGDNTFKRKVAKQFSAGSVGGGLLQAGAVGVGGGLLASPFINAPTETVKPNQQQTLLAGNRPLTSARPIVEAEKKIIGEVLSVPNNFYGDTDKVAETFLKEVDRSGSFQDMQSKLERKMKDVAVDTDDLITKHNKLYTNDEMVDMVSSLEKYKSKLSQAPGSTDRSKTISNLIDRELEWVSENAGQLDTVALQKRKVELNDMLSKFFDKNPDSFSDIDIAEQQGLNDLRGEYMKKIETVADGTADVGKIKEFNARYGDMADVKNLVKTQARKTSNVLPPTGFQEFKTRAFQRLPGVIKHLTPGFDEATRKELLIADLPKITSKLEKFAQNKGFKSKDISKLKAAFQKIVKNFDAGSFASKGVKAVEPVGIIEALQAVPGSIGEMATDFIKTSPAGMAFEKSFTSPAEEIGADIGIPTETGEFLKGAAQKGIETLFPITRLVSGGKQDTKEAKTVQDMVKEANGDENKFKGLLFKHIIDNKIDWADLSDETMAMLNMA